MATGAAIAAYIGAGAAVAGTAYSISESETTKRKAKDKQKEQDKILKEQETTLAAEEKERDLRQGRARQGRRSLLYKEGTEAGVQQSTTLGG